MRQLLVVAPLGSVVTGRSVVSRFVADRLREAGVAVTEVDVGPRSLSALARLLRPVAFLTAIRRLLSGRGRIGAVYVAVDAGIGMWLTAAVVGAARLVGASVVLHHHSYDYVQTRRTRAAVLLALAGDAAVNVVNCASMKAQLCRRYRMRADRALVMSNVVVVRSAREHRRQEQGRIDHVVTLGHLSNLSFAKGLDDAVATGIAVAERLPGSRLLVAGPFADRAARAYLEASLHGSPGRIAYLGPVGEEEKAAFLASIDVFVFPSWQETQGIVNFEALAQGVPIVSRAVGCIGEDLRDAPGAIIPREQDFVRAACDAIVGLVEGGRLGEQQRAARSYFDMQRQDAQAQLDQVVATVRVLTV